MNLTLRKDADAIIAASLKAVLPDEAVRRALQSFQPKSGRGLLAGTRQGTEAAPQARPRGRWRTPL